jgi:hypothetical protein
MLSADNISVWVDYKNKRIVVLPYAIGDDCLGTPNHQGFKGHWGDPIGAAYLQWRKMTNQQRMMLMLETAIDLAVNKDFAISDILRAFAEVSEFRALGRESYPMCRAYQGVGWAVARSQHYEL